MAKVSVIGAGSWGTALALLLSKNGHDVTMWSILEDEIRMLDKEREHKSKLPGVKLPDTMKFTTDLKEAVEGKDFLVLAVPSTFTRGTAKNMCPYVAEGQIIVDVAKGIEEATLMTLSQHEQGKLNPAQIMNHFTDEEEHREVAALFNTRIREIKTAHEQEKALKETIIRVKKNSIEEHSAKLDPTDIQGLQKLMEAKRALQDLEKLHISIN